MNRNEMLTKLHEAAMDEINETLIRLQDKTAEAGEIPRRFNDYSEEDGPVLWWDTEMTGGEIKDPPQMIGSPSDGDWPYETEDEEHLLWVPLPKLARGKP